MGKLSNIKSSISDPKTRLVWLMTAIMLVAVIGVTVLAVRRSNSAVAASASVAAVPDQTRAAGVSTGATAAYDSLVQQQNQSKAKEAHTQGGSAVPVMRQEIAVTPTQPVVTNNAAEDAQKRAERERLRQEAKAKAEKAQQEHAQRVAQYKAKLLNQSGLLMAKWENPVAITNYKISNTSNSNSGSNSGDGNYSNNSGTQSANNTIKAKSIIKAGKVCYANLDTGVNTDDTKDIRATILSCKSDDGTLDLAKTALTGKVEVNNQWSEAAVLRFNRMSMPFAAESQGVEILAIDENTYRTAVASDVDHHYVLKTVGLFASGFLEGVNEGLLKGGQTQSVTTTSNGSTVVSTESYSDKQLAMLGLSKVGAKTATAAGNLYNRPNTISIERNVGIGIVFMSDVKY